MFNAKKDYKEIYIPCDCCDTCSVIKFTELPVYNHKNKKEDYLINVCVYKCRQDKFPMIQRLRAIWNIIRFGEPYDDDIVVSRDDALKISKFINELNGEYGVVSNGENK